MKEQTDRRKHKRFRATKLAFVAIQPNYTRLGRLIDINEDGLSFEYVDGGNQPDGPFELDIFLPDGAFYLQKVPIETIWDFEKDKKGYSGPITIGRCGVQFGKLTDNQISQLKYFIQNHTARGK